MIIIAHNLRSLYNIGSIFRNAAAFGVEKLYLTGFTATPPRKEISKVALGGEDIVSWEQGDLANVVTKLKADGFAVYALETGDDAVDIRKVDQDKVAIVLGNEVEGLDKESLALVDGKLVIPMNKKQSLNVSVASGIAMYVLSARS